MLLQGTLQIKEAQWTQLRLSKIYGTRQSNSCTKQDHTCNPDTLGKPTTIISSNRVSMTSCANVELESELPTPSAKQHIKNDHSIRNFGINRETQTA